MKELMQYQTWISENVSDIEYYTPKQLVRKYLNYLKNK